jgi:hypothetical protein
MSRPLLMLQYNNRWDKPMMSIAAGVRADMKSRVWD